jgi:lysozyme family protein
MAQRSEAAAMARLFAHEGGYTNHPQDPGGPTNWGITIIDARLYGREFGWIANPTAEDVKAMPKWFAEKVYDAKYWDKQRCDELPSGVEYAIFDYGVNSGVGRSGKVLRRLVGLPDTTSTITDEVIAAVNKRDPAKLVAAICDERLAFLQALKTWPTFGKGWGRRVSEVRALGLELAKQSNVVPFPAPQAVPGKGQVPVPKAVVNTVKFGGGGLGAYGATFVEWIEAHPYETAGLALAGAVVIGGAVYLIHRNHQRKQEAAVPGIEVVPVAA